jgi:hypothetical protein
MKLIVLMIKQQPNQYEIGSVYFWKAGDNQMILRELFLQKETF